jgi:hypothetical protein
MTQSSQPPPDSPGNRLAIPFGIPAYWTPEEALTVVELLDDLRELIWAHYGVRLIELIQTQHAGPEIESDPPANPDDGDF